MRTYSKVTPEGARDILFEECRGRREVQRRLTWAFTLRGYREVMTPGIEYYDVFSLPGAALPQREMYKTTDNRGRLIVFRPDSTLPIARMAASRLQGQQKPLRLYYNQSIYRNRPDLSGRSDESAQMGVELMGAGGLGADLEVVSLAAQALEGCAPDFRMELGHAGIFRVLADQLPVSPEQKEELRATIEAKNYAALEELLEPLGENPAAEAIHRLPRLFGGEEALEEAARYCSGGRAGEMLCYLRTVYTALQKLGLGDRLMVDLGLVQRNDYYTGIVFSAYVPHHGAAVLMGGRYDGLCEKFGEPMPAVGFAVDVDACALLLENGMEEEPAPAVLVYGEPGFEAEAESAVSLLTRQGRLCELSLFETREQAEGYARDRGIPRLVLVGRQVTEMEIKRKGANP
ncbi:ATP phosphoribosyltransferase regulatory subunit [Acutalibacter sp. JLR.KK004]|uniref:ATP phosphoribosyltransferase regulatory subunit n=1 Tax=Acutalibacter sp. JLR.KK004 TaxID=3112622 RepID=UPI002FF2A245